MAVLTDAPIQFGLIPVDHWIQPLWINETKASAARESMAKTGVIYAGASFTLIQCMSVDTQNGTRQCFVRAIAEFEIDCSTALGIGICVASTPEYASNVYSKVYSC